MTIIFTDEELVNIVKTPFNWHVKEDCPPEEKKKIEKKLRLLYSQEYKQDEMKPQ